jgi:drug/metabolite transporter (DMT)-like permease
VAPNLHRTSLLKALWATLLFGSVPACIRVMKMDAYALGVWRLSLAAAGMTLMLWWQGRSPRALVSEVRREWKVLTVVGICFGLHWLTYFQSIKMSSASIGSLGFSTCGVQLPLLGWAFGFGRPGFAALVGVALAMAGSVLCLPAESPGANQALGMAIGILSGTLYAALPMLHQRHARLDNELRTWAQFAFALPVFLVAAPMADWSPISSRDFWLILHLGLLVNLVGHYLWVQISTELPLSMTSALGYLQLPVSLAFNYVLIGERMTPGMLVGAASIVVGNALALGGRSRQLISEEPPA